MKKFLPFIATLLLMTACTESESDIRVSDAPDATARRLPRRSPQEAVELALNASGLLQNQSRAEQRSSSPANVHAYVVGNARSNEADTALYFVNYDCNKGFAILSAYADGDPLLGIIEKGSFDGSELCEDNGFADFVICAAEYAHRNAVNAAEEESTPQGGVVMPPRQETKWITEWDYHQKYGPHIKLEWGQDSLYEGYYCPNKIAGCVMTACAQFLSFYEMPKTLNLTFPGRDCESTQLNWTNMKKLFTAHDAPGVIEYDPLYGMKTQTTCTLGEKDHKDIGRLCRQIGYSIGANYKSATTSADVSTAIQFIFRYYMPVCSYSHISSPSKNEIASILRNSPCLISGLTSCDVGHAWIADGYVDISVYDAMYTRLGNIDSWKLQSRVFKEYKQLIHMNWGWYGKCNGYFEPGVYDVTKAYKYDPSYNGAQRNFNFTTDIEFYYGL